MASAPDATVDAASRREEGETSDEEAPAVTSKAAPARQQQQPQQEPPHTAMPTRACPGADAPAGGATGAGPTAAQGQSGANTPRATAAVVDHRTINVALISSGFKLHTAKMIHSMVMDNGADHSFWYIDIAAKCPDPVVTENVPHATNGKNAQVQRAVFAQPQFYNFIMKFLNDFANYAVGRRAPDENRPLMLIASGECRSGFHRADTWGRTTEALLNALVDPNGCRIANAKHFSMSECTGSKSRETTAQSALGWVAAPWLATKWSLAVSASDRYGFEGAMDRQEAAHNYGNMWRYVTALNQWGFKPSAKPATVDPRGGQATDDATTVDHRGAQAFLKTPGAAASGDAHGSRHAQQAGPPPDSPRGTQDAATEPRSAADKSRAASAGRGGRRSRAPSVKRGSNKQDAAPPRKRSPNKVPKGSVGQVGDNRLPIPPSSDEASSNDSASVDPKRPVVIAAPRGRGERRAARAASAPGAPRGDSTPVAGRRGLFDAVAPPAERPRCKRSRSPSPRDPAGPRPPAGPPPGFLRGTGERRDDRRPWETFEHNAENWAEVLIEIGVDRDARRELFCLGQMGEEEFRRAQGIIAKLLKKESDHDRPHNPSGFVHSCVKIAQDELGWGRGADAPWPKQPRSHRRR